MKMWHNSHIRLAGATVSGSAPGLYSESYSYDTATGNLANKGGVGYTYGDPNHKHAVTALSNGASYQYDANGNMTTRHVYENGQFCDYTLAYDAENRLVSVSGAATASYVYNGDGARVIATVNGVTTIHIGAWYEYNLSSGQATKYYYAGSQRIAMQRGSDPLTWLLGDHLGSASVTYVSGGGAARQGYKAWGETRFGGVGSEYQYTGQYNQQALGLYFYNARWYDSSLGRFTQADTDVPESQGNSGNSVGSVSTYSPLVVDYHESRYLEQLNSENRIRFQNPDFRLSPVPTSSIVFDRYAYSLNNPVRYVDPNGHFAILAALALVTPVGWVAIGVTVVAVGVYFAVPGVREGVTNGIAQAGEAASNGLNALFAKGEYVPPSIQGEAERNAYREAVHAYKDAFGLGAATDIEKWILDEIARLLKKGVKPEDIPYQAPQPPEEDDEMEDDYE